MRAIRASLTMATAPASAITANTDATRKREFVALDELAASVSSTRRARHDRFVIQVATNVGGQFGGRAITASAVLFQSLHGDPVKVSAQQRGSVVWAPYCALPLSRWKNDDRH